jgi:hypothetical protein
MRARTKVAIAAATIAVLTFGCPVEVQWVWVGW